MMAVLNPALDAAQSFWVGLLERVPYLLSAVVVLVLGMLLARPVSEGICRVTKRRGTRHSNLGEVLSRLTRAALLLLTFLIAAVVAFPTFRVGDLIAGLGITSVAIGFAFKDILQNFFAGILILWREPFRVGDEIRSGDFEGVVEGINTRSTRIKTYDGELAVLPNGDVYTRAILVRTAFDKRRVRFVVGIAYEESIEEARRAIHKVLHETEGVLHDPGPWVYVTEFAESSVSFTVYFWTRSEQRIVLRVKDQVATGIKAALDAAGVEIPYPHSVVYLKNEGSPDGSAAPTNGASRQTHESPERR